MAVVAAAGSTHGPNFLIYSRATRLHADGLFMKASPGSRGIFAYHLHKRVCTVLCNSVIVVFATTFFVPALCYAYCSSYHVALVKKAKVHPCTGTEALYRPYSP